MGGTTIKGEVITYVGRLTANEEATVTFTIEISDSASPGYATLDLKITWTQEERVLSDIYKIRVYLTPRFSSSPTASILIIGGLATFVLAIPILRNYVIKKKELKTGE